MKRADVIEWKMQNDMKRRLCGIAGSFQKLSQSVAGFATEGAENEENDLADVLADVSIQVCRDCRDCHRCWVKQRERSCREMEEIAERLKAGEEYIAEEDGFFAQCLQQNLLMEKLQSRVFHARENRLWKNRINESREAVADQLAEMARIVSDFASEGNDHGKRAWCMPGSVYARLWMHQILAKQIILYEMEDGSLRLNMMAKCRNGRVVTVKEAAYVLERVIGERFVPCEDSKYVIGKDYSEYRFREDACYQVTTGFAKATKSKNRISGDNFSFLYPDGDEFIMILSDGMGSGEEACRESEQIIELMEQFLAAGFKEEAAMRMINSMLALRMENNMITTMDICVLHLSTGMCDFLKAGAAATYIVRENWMECLTSDNLPAGMLSHVSLETKRKKLYDGDFIVMLSDGITDVEDGDELVKKCLSEGHFESPQEIANRILDAALRKEKFEPQDDMTVLVAGITKKGNDLSSVEK